MQGGVEGLVPAGQDRDHQDLDADGGQRQRGLAQRQIGERTDTPACDCDSSNNEPKAESEDHLSLLIGRGVQAGTPTNVELLNSGPGPTDNSHWKGSQGGSHDTEVKRTMMKARLYRLALVAGVVAVFLEGLGAGAKWG